MIVKLCGLTERTDVARLADLNVDFGGFIFVKESPRYCGEVPLVLPKGVKATGVFKDAEVDIILAIASQWNLEAVQLHGSEPPTLVRNLKSAGLITLKAISIACKDDFEKCKAFEDTGLDYFVFDQGKGGTGKHFDWDLLSHYTATIPYLLAGGIGPGDGLALSKMTHSIFAGVDLNSRFELLPGEKDINLVKQFLDEELSR